jgi:hypothetical protein
MSDQHAQLSELAYHSWLRRGCPVGSPEVDWAQAEQELQQREREESLQASATLTDGSSEDDAALALKDGADTTDTTSTRTENHSVEAQEFGGNKSSGKKSKKKELKEDAISAGDSFDPEVRIQSDSGLSKNVADVASPGAKRERSESSNEQNSVQKSVARPRTRGTSRTDGL